MLKHIHEYMLGAWRGITSIGFDTILSGFRWNNIYGIDIIFLLVLSGYLPYLKVRIKKIIKTSKGKKDTVYVYLGHFILGTSYGLKLPLLLKDDEHKYGYFEIASMQIMLKDGILSILCYLEHQQLLIYT